MHNQTLIPVGHSAVIASADGPPGLTYTDTGRLDWLLKANAQAAEHRRIFRNDREEDEVLMMHHPLSARKAYAMFGLLLGTLPPATIFNRLFHYGWATLEHDGMIFGLCLFMNLVCALVGLWMGSALGVPVDNLKRLSWHRTVLCSLLFGALWGVVAGGAGGLIFFGFGAIIGILCAVPMGMIAFLASALLHRLLARGGMIDARHFWPLACGITMTIAALVLNL